MIGVIHFSDYLHIICLFRDGGKLPQLKAAQSTMLIDIT